MATHSLPPQVAEALSQIKIPQQGSHKGQNGKLLIIGGSSLFHAASKWSLDIASKFVDMVFYSSVPENNELITEAKQSFWNGIVVNRDVVEDYVEEADCILIGPGMTRTDDTAEITNHLLEKYADKKWVVDAGALQMVDPNLLNENCIITPHKLELQKIYRKRVLQLSTKLKNGSYEGNFEGEVYSTSENWNDKPLWFEDQIIYYLNNYKNLNEDAQRNFKNKFLHAAKILHGATIVAKGDIDFILSWNKNYNDSEMIVITGGNPGMTKGGTGDVLAGLVAALYCTHDAKTAAVVASYVNKAAGDALYEKVGPYFNASDLVEEIPGVMWKLLKK